MDTLYLWVNISTFFAYLMHPQAAYGDKIDTTNVRWWRESNPYTFSQPADMLPLSHHRFTPSMWKNNKVVTTALPTWINFIAKIFRHNILTRLQSQLCAEFHWNRLDYKANHWSQFESALGCRSLVQQLLKQSSEDMEANQHQQRWLGLVASSEP